MVSTVPHISLRFDLRAFPGGAAHADLYAAAVDMAEYGDRHGFNSVALSEHHGVSDGYMPSPMVLAGAMAARTKTIRLQFMAIIAPLHDPLRLAEDIAVLDNISRGRVDVTVAGGYVPFEFGMFGKEMKDRGRLTEEAIATLKSAWTGEPFEFRGRPARVMPRPFQRPHPPIWMGGSVPAAAKRAGRLADGFITHREDLYQVYFDEAKAHGKNPGPFSPASPGFVYVTEEVEAAWTVIGPYAMHETNSYGEWVAAAGTDGRFVQVKSVQEVRAGSDYLVVTPDECVALAKRFNGLSLHPLMGGLDPEFAWKGVKLFVEKVLPRL
jgi:alkanesulfonate monooxygenase SsuD/methylene tetrahydromethanopterin reductase-like flavin-dependent oxidoreductase (luciferase family)